MKPELLIALLERAITEELGIAIETNNPDSLQVLLCNARRDYGQHGRYTDLVMAMSSTPNLIFITKSTVELHDLS